MTSPRHLWSGDWESDSAAVGEQLGRQHAPVGKPQVEPPRSEQPPQAAPRTARWSALVRAVQAVRRRFTAVLLRVKPRARRRVVLAGLAAVLLSAVAAFAIVAAVTGSGGGGDQPWLGVELTSSTKLAGGFQSGFGGFPFSVGVEVTTVVPGGPAAAAGIEPGDVIIQVGEQQVSSPAGVQAAIAGMKAGDMVQLVYQQGPSTFITRVTLGARPAP
jgi:hypothetical protein